MRGGEEIAHDSRRMDWSLWVTSKTVWINCMGGSGWEYCRGCCGEYCESDELGGGGGHCESMFKWGGWGKEVKFIWGDKKENGWVDFAGGVIDGY
jgi:hypothetical protein